MAEQRMGLDYFSLDTSMADDDKVFMLRSIYATEAPGGYDPQASYACYGRLVELLQELYREGFCMELTDLRRFKLSQRLGLAPVDFDVLVERCVQVGLFDEGLYRAHGVLTSRGIQRRYFEATKRRKGSVPERLRRFVLPDHDGGAALPAGDGGGCGNGGGQGGGSDGPSGAGCCNGGARSGPDCSNMGVRIDGDCSNEGGFGADLGASGAADAATLPQSENKEKDKGRGKGKEDEEGSSSSRPKRQDYPLACLSLMAGGRLYADDAGEAHGSPWDAIVARYSHAMGGQPIDAYARGVAGLCPGSCDCSEEQVGECYRLISSALARFDPAKSSNPLPLTRAVLGDRSIGCAKGS